MSTLFRGSRWHWSALLAVIVLLGFIGERGLHVRQFSVFLFVILGISFALVLLIALSSTPSQVSPKQS